MTSIPEDGDLEVLEAQAPLTIITWSAAVVLAGIATIVAMLVLGPILGAMAMVAVTVTIVRRYEESGDAAPAAVEGSAAEAAPAGEGGGQELPAGVEDLPGSEVVAAVGS